MHVLPLISVVGGLFLGREEELDAFAFVCDVFVFAASSSASDDAF